MGHVDTKAPDIVGNHLDACRSEHGRENGQGNLADHGPRRRHHEQDEQSGSDACAGMTRAQVRTRFASLERTDHRNAPDQGAGEVRKALCSKFAARVERHIALCLQNCSCNQRIEGPHHCEKESVDGDREGNFLVPGGE